MELVVLPELLLFPCIYSRYLPYLQLGFYENISEMVKNHSYY